MDESSGYHLSAVLEFESREAFDKAQGADRLKELMDDVGSGSFTKSEPAFSTGDSIV